MSRSPLTTQGTRKEGRGKCRAEERGDRPLPICLALGSNFLGYPCRGPGSLQPSLSPRFPVGAVCKHPRPARTRLPHLESGAFSAGRRARETS